MNDAESEPAEARKKRKSGFVSLFLLVFRPKRFIELAVEHDFQNLLATDAGFRKTHADRAMTESFWLHNEPNERSRTETMRAGLAKSLRSTITSVVAGIVIGGAIRWGLQHPLRIIAAAVAVSGAAVLLAATLALRGREIASWDRETLPEELDASLFRTLYWIGTFLIVSSLLLAL